VRFVAVLKAGRRALCDPGRRRKASTGECVRRAGNEMLFQADGRHGLVETLNGLGRQAHRHLRSACAELAEATSTPAFGGHYEVRAPHPGDRRS
jgi:hypothetical protein